MLCSRQSMSIPACYVTHVGIPMYFGESCLSMLYSHFRSIIGGVDRIRAREALLFSTFRGARPRDQAFLYYQQALCADHAFPADAAGKRRVEEAVCVDCV